jgi:eukaryotic-like serine/threonine-protein kinase
VIGETLAHYRILQKIGSGGMGEVYAAEDAKLNRRVALKVLPAPLARGEDQRARLTREAKALAALNHPNIVAVYSVEADRGVDFITMELVKGKTLAELLPRDGFALERFFDIAIPLADAVAAAHAQGVVHRDLKPSNIMVTDEGRLKVLDFGLARPSAAPGVPTPYANAPTITMTEVGVVAGTWSYMSPEQARGHIVDARSDIFALGIVFHEMLTGRRPFAGDSSNDVLSSILKDAAPDASSIRPRIPRELSRLVRRCLAKDPARRVQSALDIRNELEDLRREIGSGELTADVLVGKTRPSGGRWALWAIPLVVAALAIGFVRWLSMGGAVLQVQSPRQLTFAEGVEESPTLSPDGQRIAFAADGDIWVVQASGGPPQNLTRDHPGADREPAWSPDGAQIAFVSNRDGEPAIYLMPAIGGAATRLSPGPGNYPHWSPDGTEVAYLRRPARLQSQSMIEITSLHTRKSRFFQIPRAGNHHDLTWSPDGRFFANVHSVSRGEGISRLWLLRISDEREFAITDGSSDDWSPMWSKDARTLFYISNRGGSRDLWQQPLTADGAPDGDPLPITVGIGMGEAALSVDGRRFAYSKGRPVSHLWRVPLLEDREAGWQDAERLISDEADTGSVDSFREGDGRERLVFSSDRGGYDDLWTLALDSKQLTQLTNDRAPDVAPRFSPDGQRIAFYSYRSGNRDIWVMPSKGGPAAQLTRDEASQIYPSWKPDGSQIVFYGTPAGGLASKLWVVPASGGEVNELASRGETSMLVPQWSPDGVWLAYATSQPRVYLIPASGGPEQLLPNTPSSNFRWSSDSKHMYFRRQDDLVILTVADGTERRLTRFSGRAGNLGQGFAVGLAHLYFTWGRGVGDIWVMDVVTDRE